MTVAIRLLATALILVPVYGETGPWTVTFLALMAAGNELQLWLRRGQGHPHESVPEASQDCPGHRLERCLDRLSEEPRVSNMQAFHLGACRRDRDLDPAGDGCHPDCPRRLHSEVAQLRENLLAVLDESKEPRS